MAKPTREFNANEGDYSIGLAGPDAIENDLDFLIRMFDPLTTHDTGEQGGISTENIQDNTITDELIGERTIDSSLATRDSEGKFPQGKTGTINYLFALLAKLIQEIKGTDNFDDVVILDLKQIKDNINSISNFVASLHNMIMFNKNNIEEKLENHKTSDDHDSRYYTKDEISLHIKGGDTLPKEEAFTIVNADNGDGTFTYKNGTQTYIGELTEEGYQVFELKSGEYTMNNSSIVVWVDDSLRRTPVSGGVIEISNKSFALTDPEGEGTEISVEYLQRVGMLGEHNIIISEQEPPYVKNTIWFKIIP